MLTVLYGGGVYLQAATLTRVLAIVAGTSAFVSVFAHAALARGSRWSLYPWFAAAVEIILIEWRHADMIQVAQGSVIALLVALIGLGTSERSRGADQDPYWCSRRIPTCSPQSFDGLHATGVESMLDWCTPRRTT